MLIVPDGLTSAFRTLWEKKTGRYVHDINSGWCYQFALILKLIHGDKAKIYYNYVHAWIEIDGILYDADYPLGMKRVHNQSEVAVDDAVGYWNTNGISGE